MIYLTGIASCTPRTVGRLAIVIFALTASVVSAQVVRRTQTFSTSTMVVNDASPTCAPSSTPIVTLEETFGPACIGIGNRDIANPAPACGGNPAATGVDSPSRGTAFIVVVGSINLNTNTHNNIVNCTAPRVIPTIGSGALALIAMLLAIFGMARMYRMRPVERLRDK
jgi:hypothetical protein